jgi:UDP-glucose:O-linked fucose beta-1,3-glucosyltransferase
VQREKEEDNLILHKYTKEDDQRLKSLSLQIEKMIGEVHRRQSQLRNHVRGKWLV